MADANPYADDPNVPDRQPAFCPYCGAEGGPFGGLGLYAPYNHPDAGGERLYRHHCPDCDNEFITIIDSETTDHA